MRIPHLARGCSAIGLLFVCQLAFSSQQKFTLSNRQITAGWQLTDGVIRSVDLIDRASGKRLSLADFGFSLVLEDGSTISETDLQVIGNPKVESVSRNSGAPKLSDRLGGRQLVVNFTDRKGRLNAKVTAVLRDGSRYIREEVSISAIGRDLPVRHFDLINLQTPGIVRNGSTQGSPLTTSTLFAGIENPLSIVKAENGRGTAWVDRKLPIRAGQTATESSVIGFSDEGQLRRSFLAYVERERAHPYRTFLHYNSWYDIGYFTPYNESDCLNAIHAFSDELVRKRHVTMSSFLFDDGWDDTSTVWKFHRGFPNGFLPIKAAAEQIHAEPGIWLSPWGGYGGPRDRRLATGKAQGFEIDSEGYALSGQKYFQRFHDVTMDLVQKYGINQFKFDGTGSPDKQFPGSAFGSDFEAAIKLIEDLRTAKPDLFINLTTGTWPSPFWTRYADSIWRGGSDHSFAGVGSSRQQWITYRDTDTYRGIVRRGPLYPLNSLMLHGIIYAQHANRLNTDPQGDFKSEVRDYFGTGTQLQEMYITPSLLSKQNWDDLAEAARWSKSNADSLVDTHWVGGSPQRLEVYGWASWNPKKATLTLRNPSDKPQTFSIDAQSVFELPKGSASRYLLNSPWAEDAQLPSIQLEAGKPTVVTLKPFEVLVWNAKPER